MLKAAWVSHETLELNLMNKVGILRRRKGEEPSRKSGRFREHGILGNLLELQGQGKQGMRPTVCQILL